MYEIRAEYKTAAPGLQGDFRRGPVNVWHICPVGVPTGLCDRALSTTAETIPIESWPTLLPGEESLIEHKRCRLCTQAFAGLGQPGSQPAG